ncbi:zinc-binding alcohol dehydrogenase family protein [Epilithonimonas sp. UC225_85]|uniref:quinone oxidoreductase family protein n=1 Tax=Epilithonimonas sp. UC225_85 TaxID=3350167 RepID=UPI0036D3A85D
MKTAVIFPQTGNLQLIDLTIPTPKENEVLVSMKCVAMKHLDKAIASGTHYSSENDISKAKIIGSDGVGILENGNRVYVVNPKGTLAEKIIVDKNFIVPIPDGLEDSIASALPNAVMGSAMGMKFRAKMQFGETVLINGATGFTGKVAVQIAKIYGAKNIIVTGRNETETKKLLQLGADEYILTTDENFTEKLKSIHQNSPIDIVIDYLWGKSAEDILEAIKGNGSFSHRTRFVSIGSITGDSVQLSSQILRGTDLQISGSGLGSWTKPEIGILLTEILPEMFELAVNKKLNIETESIDLDNISEIWNQEMNSNKRLVIKI